MSAESKPKFPIVVDEPASIRTGKLFLRDLASLDPAEVNSQVLIRALTTIGEAHRSAELLGIVVPDQYTGVLDYADGVKCQVEILMGDTIVTDGTVQKLEDYVREDDWQLLVLTKSNLSNGAKSYCRDTPDVDVTRLEIEPRTGGGVW